MHELVIVCFISDLISLQLPRKDEHHCQALLDVKLLCDCQ